MLGLSQACSGWRRVPQACGFAALLLGGALLFASSVRAQNATWLASPTNNNFDFGSNWVPDIVPTGTASFNTSNITGLTFNSASTTVGGFTLNAGASAYTFTNVTSTLIFNGAGIVINGGSANIVNNALTEFNSSSTAGNATVTTNPGGITQFNGNSTGGNARLITNGTVDFSSSSGPTGNKQLAAGSIEGSGSYYLGGNTLTVGGNNLSTAVTGAISDCGTGGTACSNAGATGGSLVKVGTGTLTLSGANTYSGTTTVNAGTLVVNGTLSDPTVNSGGTLAGTGTVAATQVNAGGTLAPGPTGGIGTLTIAGNLAFQSGAFYVINLNPSTASLASVTGTASLAGTVQANFATGSYVQKQYLILSATGGITGTFAAITGINQPAGTIDTLSYTGNAVYLNLKPGFAAFSGLPSNWQNVANTLTNYFNSTGGLPSIFFGVTSSGLAQLDGEVSADGELGAFQMMTAFLGLMLDPFVDGRLGGFGGGSNGGSGAIGFAPEQQAFLPDDVALAYAAILNKAPPAAPFQQRWTMWGASYGGGNWTNGSAAVGSSNVSAQTYGFVGGADYHFSPDTIAGFSLGGGGLSWGLANANGTGRSDAFQAGVYGITRLGPAYLAGALGFANQWMTTNRSALGDIIAASFAGQSYGARAEGGYRVAVLPVLGVTPYGAVQPQLFRTPSYSETDLTGGGLGLTYASASATDVRTEIGSRLDSPVVIGGMPLVLRGRVAWAHDFVNGTALSAAFQTLPGTSFVVNGAAIPQNSALTSAGAELFLTPKWTLLAKFDGEFAAGSQTYAGTGTLRYAW